MVRRARKPDPREVVELRAGRRCEYCRAPQTATGIRYHLEHVFPESLGWSDDVDTLALACPTCNYFKSNHLLGIDEEGLAGRPLFNPRRDQWHEHFEFDSSTLQLKGKTNTGKGTVNRLRMNNSMQLEARRLWVELELLPLEPKLVDAHHGALRKSSGAPGPLSWNETSFLAKFHAEAPIGDDP